MNLAAAYNTMSGIDLSTSSNNKFTGLLKVGNNTGNQCSVTGGTNPGLLNATCTPTTPSDPSDTTLTFGASVLLNTSFVGKVTTDDTANASDASGYHAAIAATDDWTNFDNSYRGWGKYDANPFPFTSHQGRAGVATEAQMWDWSLETGDTVIKGVNTKRLIPAAQDEITHKWTGAAANQAACTILMPGSV
jgi:hypothetical protein